MSDLDIQVDGTIAGTAAGWRLEWDDATTGVGRLVGDGRAIPVLVEGSGTEWVVTLRGRRISVTVRTWRERLLAEAERSSIAHAGPVVVKASLPGLIVSVAVTPGDTVEAAAPLVTIEAMKMQNEVRAPRAGRVRSISVSPGQAVATGAPLLELE